MDVAIWWARRDLRLTDNPALTQALASARQVVPAFVLDPTLLRAPTAGAKRVAWLLEALRSLDRDLRSRGSHLVVRRGEPLAELQRLMDDSGAQAIFAEADVWPYGAGRDRRVREALPLELTDGLTVRAPGAVLKADGHPYTVFTPYSRTWKALPLPRPSDLLPAPERISTPVALASLALPERPSLPKEVPFPASEAEAQRRLEQFTTGESPPIWRYGQGRDQIGAGGTSRLSPYLRFGLLSARHAAASAVQALESAPDEEARKGAGTWLNELIWREFYVDIMLHFPQVLQTSFRPGLREVPWDNNESAFASWCEGRTGYPIVDAAMRQLVKQGWMHNRARMIVASFLVKDLLIDWRWGERFFETHLLDADPPSNNGGWQWTAGTGTDAAPYFRIFNPVLQGKRHDPRGVFVRQWVPELERVPDRHIHEPWKMSQGEQREAGCWIGKHYSAPIVDHLEARERTLAAYAAARESRPR